jgi:small subunit ribosomal protein S16
VAVKIKLKRLGRTRVPHYRIVVADARTRRDGRAIEEIGEYHPKDEPSLIEVNSERALHWLSVGAQPTEPVKAILKLTGDWQKFKGEPGAEGTLRTPGPRDDKKERFAAALTETSEGAASSGSRSGRQKQGGRAQGAKENRDAGRQDSGQQAGGAEAAGDAASGESEPGEQ